MQNDFDAWNMVKKSLHSRQNVPFCHARELWWCSLGINIGSEQNGSGKHYARPVLILKSLTVRTSLAVPLTSSARDDHFRLYMGRIDGKEARLLITQVRMIDTRRLLDKIGYVKKSQFEEIQKTLRNIYF